MTGRWPSCRRSSRCLQLPCWPRANAATTDFLALLRALVAERREHPGDPEADVLTRLIHGDGGDQFSEAELLHNCIFLLNAGHETTSNLIGNGVHALMTHRDATRSAGRRACAAADCGRRTAAIRKPAAVEQPADHRADDHRRCGHSAGQFSDPGDRRGQPRPGRIRCARFGSTWRANRTVISHSATAPCLRRNERRPAGGANRDRRVAGPLPENRSRRSAHARPPAALSRLQLAAGAARLRPRSDRIRRPRPAKPTTAEPTMRIAAAVCATAMLTLAPSHAFDLQGHRGARGLAPENSIPGWKKALELGVDTIECDMGVTKDDVVVVHHDLRLNADTTRTGDGQWLTAPGPNINQLTFDELQRYDIGRLKPGSNYAKEFPDQQAVDGTRVSRNCPICSSWSANRATSRSASIAKPSCRRSNPMPPCPPKPSQGA